MLESSVTAGKESSPRLAVEKIANLTGVRGVAALCVAFAHFQLSTNFFGSQDDADVIGNGAWAVDVFFVLSGFVMARTYAGGLVTTRFDWAFFRQYLIKRLARIYPLHFVTFMITALLWSVASIGHYRFNSLVDYSIETAVLNLFLVQAWGISTSLSWNAASWSVSAEFFAYLLVFTPSVRYFGRVASTYQVAFVAATWLIVTAVAHGVFQISITHISTSGIIRIIPEFVAGVVLWQRAGQIRLNGDVCAIGGTFAIVGLSFCPLWTEYLMLPAIVFLIYGLSRGGAIANSFFGAGLLVFLGEISYSIYLTHPLVDIVLNQLVRRFEVFELITEKSLLILIKLLVAIAVAYVSYRFIEVPARRYLTRLFVRPSFAS